MVIVLKFHRVMILFQIFLLKTLNGIAKSEVPDQIKEQSNLGLH